VTAGGWRQHARCGQVDPELFFPVVEDSPALIAQVEAAKAICADCPVRETCLEFALTSLSHGIAGGLTALERAQLRATQRGRPKQGAA
jgi:WhiB family redox-sensing transcriptional regulator